jgi:mannosylglycoprotein endo-beta-mannosidase
LIYKKLNLCINVIGSLWSGIAAGNGLFTDGPYTIQIPEKFFMEYYYPYAFNPEVGNVGVPNADTIRATMPPEAWDPPAALAGEHPNPTWWYHKYIGYADGQNLIPGQIEAFGKYNDLDDFCEKVT